MNDDLFERILDGTLDDAAAGALLRQCEEDPTRLEELLDFIWQDIQLKELGEDRQRLPATPAFSFQDDQRRFLDQLCRAAESSPSLAESREEPAAREAAPRSTFGKPDQKIVSKRKTSLIPLVACLVCFLAWIGLSFMEITGTSWEDLVGRSRSRETRRPVLALLSETVEPVWSRQTPAYRSGEALQSETLTLLSGIFSLLLSDGTKIIVSGDSVVSLDSPDRVSCRRGKFSFQVPPRQQKLEVALPECTIVVLGTTFSVHSTDQGSEIHLLSGRIELKDFAGNASTVHRLQSGQAVRIDSAGKIESLSADPEKCISEETMAHWVTFSKEQEKERWFASRRNWSQENGLRLGLDFEGASEDAAGSLAPIIRGGRSVEGRFVGKKALRFSQPEDGVFLSGICEPDSLTLAASLRPDAFNESDSTLFFSQKNVRGSAFWRINSNGTVIFGGANENRVGSFRSSKPLVPEQLGHWLHLAVVVDQERKTVTHYFNGRAVSTEKIPEKLRIRIDDAVIGRGHDGGRPRSFNGCIDEFRIFDRALTPEEIRGIVEGTF